jgi:hypothetical protein
VEGQHDHEQALRTAHFPKAPPGDYEPQKGGHAFERINADLVGSLLGMAANWSAPGDDCISVGIIKVFREWDQQRITQLVGTCIRLGHHQKLWKAPRV